MTPHMSVETIAKRDHARPVQSLFLSTTHHDGARCPRPRCLPGGGLPARDSRSRPGRIFRGRILGTMPGGSFRRCVPRSSTHLPAHDPGPEVDERAKSLVEDIIVVISLTLVGILKPRKHCRVVRGGEMGGKDRRSGVRVMTSYMLLCVFFRLYLAWELQETSGGDGVTIMIVLGRDHELGISQILVPYTTVHNRYFRNIYKKLVWRVIGNILDGTHNPSIAYHPITLR